MQASHVSNWPITGLCTAASKRQTGVLTRDPELARSVLATLPHLTATIGERISILLEITLPLSAWPGPPPKISITTDLILANTGPVPTDTVRNRMSCYAPVTEPECSRYQPTYADIEGSHSRHVGN